MRLVKIVQIVVDIIIHKNHYALIKKRNVLLVDHQKNFICRRCLNSYTSENMLLHKQKSGDDNIATIKIHLILIFIGKIIFIRIRFILDYMLILKLIPKKIILV